MYIFLEIIYEITAINISHFDVDRLPHCTFVYRVHSRTCWTFKCITECLAIGERAQNPEPKYLVEYYEKVNTKVLPLWGMFII